MLKWWLLYCSNILIAGVAHYFGFTNLLLNGDPTRIGFFILVMFFLTSTYVGKQTYDFSAKHILPDLKPQWFIAQIFTTLGMIGTVIGFLLLLTQVFVDLDVSNNASLQNALVKMTTGMGTALLTTLLGLVCSSLLKIQLLILEYDIEHNEHE